MTDKFRGFLLCTDFDGTFAVGGQPVQQNIDAVRYFVENGGRFTVATGRLVEFVREKGLHAIINAPACLCNGSVIYDYGRDLLLRERRLDITVQTFLQAVREEVHLICQFHVFSDIVDGHTCYESLDAVSPLLMQMKPLKLMCKFETEEQADEFKKFALSCPELQNCYISKSWRFGVEFNALDATKGYAVDFIRDYLGDVHTVIGVGDFENDIPLVQHADISAAPANAAASVLDLAQVHLRINKEGAIKELIEKIEERI